MLILRNISSKYRCDYKKSYFEKYLLENIKCANFYYVIFGLTFDEAFYTGKYGIIGINTKQAWFGYLNDKEEKIIESFGLPN